MTEATPLASEQITQDRDTAAQLACETFYGNEWQWGMLNEAFREKWREVVDAALSASPAPSGQGVSGEVARLNYALSECERAAKSQMDDCHRAAHSDLIEPETKRGWASGAANSGVIYRKILGIRAALAAPAPSCAPGEVDWAKVGREYADKALAGGIPQVRSPQYALSGTLTAMAQEIERLRAALSPQGLDAKEGGASCDGVGWVFFNEDAGEEYAPNHPVESGEVPDATRIRRSTAQEDVLWNAFQGEFQRAHALETATPSQRLDAATVEGIAQERADWLLDAVAVATQDRRYLRGSLEYDEVAGEAILLNGAKAIRVEMERALATEPHQHGGKGA